MPFRIRIIENRFLLHLYVVMTCSLKISIGSIQQFWLYVDDGSNRQSVSHDTFNYIYRNVNSYTLTLNLGQNICVLYFCCAISNCVKYIKL